MNLERQEATTLLKELVEANLVKSHFVHFKETEKCKFDLIIKGICDPVELRQFIAKKDLLLLVDKEKDTCKIYRP